MTEQTKICTVCKTKKQINSFGKNKTGRFGVASRCKICTSIYNKKRYRANPEKYIACGERYYKNNMEKVRIRTKKWRDKNPEKMRAYGKKYRTDHAEQNRAARNAWRNKHKSNGYKLNCSMRTNIGKSLKGNKNGRRWEDLVGYTLKDLKKHLKKQFGKGMTWDNYGEWHIDHKIPISTHNFTKPEHEDFKKCWSLKNLQPMWANRNLKKGTKLTNHFQPSLLM